MLLLLAEKEYESHLITLIVDVLSQRDIDNAAILQKLDDLCVKRELHVAAARRRVETFLRGAPWA